jgi:hypothetical protein
MGNHERGNRSAESTEKQKGYAEKSRQKKWNALDVPILCVKNYVLSKIHHVNYPAKEKQVSG